MKVHLLQTVGGVAVFDKIVEMDGVPQEGDMVALNMDDGALRVETVIWTPFDKTDCAAQVRLR